MMERITVYGFLSIYVSKIFMSCQPILVCWQKSKENNFDKFVWN